MTGPNFGRNTVKNLSKKHLIDETKRPVSLNEQKTMSVLMGKPSSIEQPLVADFEIMNNRNKTYENIFLVDYPDLFYFAVEPRLTLKMMEPCLLDHEQTKECEKEPLLKHCCKVI